MRPRAHSTRTEQGERAPLLTILYSHSEAAQAEAVPVSFIDPDQTPVPSMPEAELDSASAPSMEPDQAPASSMPDTEPKAVSVVTTEDTQAAAPSTATSHQWRWRRRLYPPLERTPRPSYEIRTPRPSYDIPDFSALNEEVRRAMRTVPHALAVVTSKTPMGVTKGLVVSSFNTVTMRTKPYITFNIKLPSSTYDAIARSHRFTITSIWSAETAKAFANPSFSLDNPLPLEDADPRSLHAGGLFSLVCKWYKVKSVKIKDHVIMLGRVDEYHPGRPQNITKSPLVYVKGDYQMGPRSNPWHSTRT